MTKRKQVELEDGCIQGLAKWLAPRTPNSPTTTVPASSVRSTPSTAVSSTPTTSAPASTNASERIMATPVFAPLTPGFFGQESDSDAPLVRIPDEVIPNGQPDPISADEKADEKNPSEGKASTECPDQGGYKGNFIAAASEMIQGIASDKLDGLKKGLHIEDFELTEKNIEEFEEKLNSRYFEIEHLRNTVPTMTNSPQEAEHATEGVRAKKNRANMQEQIATGKIDAKSYAGKQFNTWLAEPAQVAEKQNMTVCVLAATIQAWMRCGWNGHS